LLHAIRVAHFGTLCIEENGLSGGAEAANQMLRRHAREFVDLEDEVEFVRITMA
jgi:hypothetical protein